MKVNIIVQLDGWILEKLARRLEVLPYVKITGEPDYSADINYYMSYALFTQKNKRDVVFFSHYEPKHNTLTKKWEYCVQNQVIGVVMEEKYRNLLLQQGLKKVNLIPPGVNIQYFKPKTVIGSAGKSFTNPHRKGEDILRYLISFMPNIEFRLGGVGNDRTTYIDMRNFYYGLDAYFSPERYGTSECVAEALACGVPVIARKYVELGKFKPPIYEYETVNDAVNIINKLHNEKMKRWELIGTHYNSKHWVSEHELLFNNLMKGDVK